MRKYYILSAFFLFLATSLSSAQEIQLTLDRNEIARGETVILTIRIYDQRQGTQLDLTPLTDQFDVLGTRTSSQIRSINGTVEAWTDYIVTLFPLIEGELTIPALNINNQITEPISINVVNEGPRSNQASSELFLEIETNKESVYVQEQLLFTVRLYYTINGIRNPQFTDLEMPDSVIQLIGSPNQYEKLIDGARYGVYEKRYVVFPQRSGPLEIPDILFRGEVTDGSSNFVFRNLNTRRVTAFIEGITIDVKERPASVQNTDFWLPVSNLTVEESWSTDLNSLKVGDSVTRTLTMIAEGLDGAVLPPFGPSEIDGLNLYPDPPDIQRTFVDGAIVGTRIETTSMVPITSGDILIPQISIPWWNIDTDQLEATIVPATRIIVATIEGIVPSEQAIASTENIEDLLAAAPIVDQDMIDEQNAAEFIEVDSFWMNLAIALAFIIVTLSIYNLIIANHKQEIKAFANQKRLQILAHYSAANNEAIAFKQLQRACRENNSISTRESLIQWCDHFLDKHSIKSMEDILQQTEVLELREYATQIQSSLYNSSNNTEFSSQSLLSLVSELRKQKKKSTKTRKQEDLYCLPPLYKA